ncbi:MAG: sulfotransferase domain-containing protein [Verrucomicrobiae bacterium]|nr:sulfotransferase domain-containing protein [Verrucomicrobiae bacterium]
MSVQPSNPFPLLVVAGMPRAGTTFLYHYLQQHPSIYLAFRKEIDYFNAHYHFKGRDWFASLFRGIKPGQIAGDLSPACWNDPQAPEWIREFNPDTKVILCLRDPAEFAVSLFRQKNHSHYDVPPTLEKWLHDGYESRLTEKGGPVFFTFHDGEFEQKLDAYKKAFGENLLIYDFSFFTKNQLTILQAIEDFLGIDPYFDESNFDNLRINASYRRNIKWLYAITAQEWFRNLFERYVPRTWAMRARAIFDRISVVGEPSKDASKVRHTPEEVTTAREILPTSCAAFREIFQDHPIYTGDGKPFALREKAVSVD